jgi:NADPH:quinone reductase-like Zn-dependent oxidoreductase
LKKVVEERGQDDVDAPILSETSRTPELGGFGLSRLLVLTCDWTAVYEQRRMKAAGIDHYGDNVRPMTISEPRRLEPDELLLQVCTAGVGNWDNIARTGGWNLGIAPPMALGVEAAGTVLAVGSSVQRARVGDALITHPVPLPDHGTWAERVIVAENTVARKPVWMPWLEAGGFPVPGLTAYQTVVSALQVEPGEWLLVHGAGGVTGSLIVTVAAELGARVIATAGPDATQRTLDAGAMHVVDYHHADWPRTVMVLTAQQGVAAAANAVRGQASVALQTVHPGGRLATITGDPPLERDGITVSNVYVRADGEQLQRVTNLLEQRQPRIPIAGIYGLEEAAQALSAVVESRLRGAAILEPQR